jgi:hypothetical protein
VTVKIVRKPEEIARKWLWSLFNAPSQHLSGEIVLIFVQISGEQP